MVPDELTLGSFAVTGDELDALLRREVAQQLPGKPPLVEFLAQTARLLSPTVLTILPRRKQRTKPGLAQMSPRGGTARGAPAEPAL